ncbi:6-phosphogluconate dehydrogenase C-terminal domain-like protein [Choiromyces venosus 120613-1]|uniref:6-phosphogluconate dehydrogenase, decarboxylating n=1 Tax=Choiromyces venosus 120613-1 TaxID=1336337 RepID=A0A3N4JTR0_9PEZI|nr:6-phosphogluconate dehydrogenase C-terminal domain-like protein [Choiromyces venosus 120613-1]
MTSFRKIGVVGAGSMGSNMAMLFAEHDLEVSIFDVKAENIDSCLKMCDSQKSLKDRIKGFNGYGPFIESLGKDSDKLFLLSISHGKPVDVVLESLKPHLNKGDVIIDGGNEYYRDSERRMQGLGEHGIGYIGMGVSGGYQSARRGPSMSPGGDAKVVERVMPILERFAAKDAMGNPCVKYIGPGGPGHYAKMVHNGIEQSMMGVLNEAWEMLFKCLNGDLDEISRIFMKWNNEGELRGNFLVKIGSDICLCKKDKGPSHVLNDIQDKVVQDADNTEGTGVLTVMESAARHVSAPTIASSHYYRVASANRAERLQFFGLIGGEAAAKKQHVDDDDERVKVIEGIPMAVYCGFLCAFAQGMNLIARASKDEGWGVNIADCVKIWRAGCIVQSDEILDLILPVYGKDGGFMNLLLAESFAGELKKSIGSLKRTVANGLMWDTHIPAMSASLEYLKYCGGKHLPTQFMEAELDCFGAPRYDLKSEGSGEVKKGAHHYEWEPA